MYNHHYYCLWFGQATVWWERYRVPRYRCTVTCFQYLLAFAPCVSIQIVSLTPSRTLAKFHLVYPLKVVLVPLASMEQNVGLNVEGQQCRLLPLLVV
jgi:hypothetical protein